MENDEKKVLYHFKNQEKEIRELYKKAIEQDTFAKRLNSFKNFKTIKKWLGDNSSNKTNRNRNYPSFDRYVYFATFGICPEILNITFDTEHKQEEKYLNALAQKSRYSRPKNFMVNHKQWREAEESNRSTAIPDFDQGYFKYYYASIEKYLLKAQKRIFIYDYFSNQPEDLQTYEKGGNDAKYFDTLPKYYASIEEALEKREITYVRFISLPSFYKPDNEGGNIYAKDAMLMMFLATFKHIVRCLKNDKINCEIYLLRYAKRQYSYGIIDSNILLTEYFKVRNKDKIAIPDLLFIEESDASEAHSNLFEIYEDEMNTLIKEQDRRQQWHLSDVQKIVKDLNEGLEKEIQTLEGNISKVEAKEISQRPNYFYKNDKRMRKLQKFQLNCKQKIIAYNEIIKGGKKP